MSPRHLSTFLLSRAATTVSFASAKRIPLIASSSSIDTSQRTLSSAANSDEDEEQEKKSRVTTTIQSNGIAHVKLARPKKMNALDLPMFEAIADTAESLATDKSIRAVILSGEGRAFSTGLDLKSIAKRDPLQAVKKLLAKRPSQPQSPGNLAQDVGYLWRRIPAPVICVMHGMCFGGGLQIALGADMRFSTPDCQVSIMEAKWGLIPDMSASVTLRELMSIDVAKELTMTGRILTGEQAAAYNLVTRCVEDPMAEAEKVALEIIEKSPDAVAASKRLFQNNWVNKSEEEALQYEEKLQRTLLGSWNQMAAAVDNFGVKVPYFKRKEEEMK